MGKHDDDTICEVCINENGHCPILASFQNSKLQIGAEHKLKTRFYKNDNDETVITAKAQDMLYTGVVKPSDKLYRKFLLIRNRASGKVRLVELEAVVLAPYFEKSVDTVDNLLSPPPESTIKTLKKQFGSKRTKRFVEQQERMTMNVENIKEQLEKTVANMEFDESELMSATQIDENDSLHRPPINRNASAVEEVYDLADLVPFDVLNSLHDEAESVITTEFDSDRYCTFIYQHLMQLKSTTKDLGKCKILLYVNYLISFLIKPARLLANKRVQICETSRDVNKHILDNFTVTSNTGRTRPLTMRDRAVCYILVLLMIALNYEINIENLSKDIKIGIKKLQEICRILAFSPYTLHNKSVVVLRLPLPPPINVSMRNNKRKR